MLLWVLNLDFAASGSDAPPPVVVADVTPAGRHKRRYFLEIDGQQFLVNSAEDARQILGQARALAERQSEIKADRVVRRLSSKVLVPQIKLQTPVITASPELDVSDLIADIKRLYQKAAEMAELRLLMKRKADEDDEDELFLLL